jgi:hypothetical protein
VSKELLGGLKDIVVLVGVQRIFVGYCCSGGCPKNYSFRVALNDKVEDLTKDSK